MLFRCENPVKIAKRMCWLAWQASQVMGMGVLQNRSMTEDQVWSAATGGPGGDYPIPHGSVSEVNADYVAGRMMKLRLKLSYEGVTVSDAPPRSDYQSWCKTYPTYDALIVAALK